MVPSVPRDSTIASSMIVQDYIAKRFRGEKPILSRYDYLSFLDRPVCVDAGIIAGLPQDGRRRSSYPLKRDAKHAYI